MSVDIYEGGNRCPQRNSQSCFFTECVPSMRVCDPGRAEPNGRKEGETCQLGQAAVEAGTNTHPGHLLCAQNTFISSPSQRQEAAAIFWPPTPLPPRRKWSLAKITQLVGAELALELRSLSRQTSDSPCSAHCVPLLPLPPAWCLSKNLEEYFWNEVSNTLSHFY